MTMLVVVLIVLFAFGSEALSGVRLQAHEVAAIEEYCETNSCRGQTEQSRDSRRRVKQAYITQILSTNANGKRADAEAEAEEILELVQQAKQTVLNSMGLDKVEPFDDGLWQTDILLRKHEAEDIIRRFGGTVPRSRLKRSVQSPEVIRQMRWIYPIPYIIDSTLDSKSGSRIDRQLGTVTAALPCLAFKKVATAPTDRPYMQFTSTFQGAYIGMSPGANLVGVFPDSFIAQSSETYVSFVILHELFHSLGLTHEQQRGDRDKYIKITLENIEPQYAYAYAQDSNATYTTYGVPYNFYSMLHYASNSYGINGKTTMVSIVPPIAANTKAMGQSMDTGTFNQSDIIILNRTYCQNPNSWTPSPSYVMSLAPYCFTAGCATSPAYQPKDPAACPAGFSSVVSPMECFRCASDCTTAQSNDTWSIAYARQYPNVDGCASTQSQYRLMKVRKCTRSDPTPVCEDQDPQCGYKAQLKMCSDAAVAKACPKSCATSVCSKIYTSK